MYDLLRRSTSSLSSAELLVWARKRPYSTSGDHLDLLVPQLDYNIDRQSQSRVQHPHTSQLWGRDRASSLCCRTRESLHGNSTLETLVRFGRVFSTRRGRGEERERRSGERGNYLSTQENRSIHQRRGGLDIAFLIDLCGRTAIELERVWFGIWTWIHSRWNTGAQGITTPPTYLFAYGRYT